MNDEKDKVDINLSDRSYENSPDPNIAKQRNQQMQEGYNNPNQWSNSRMMGGQLQNPKADQGDIQLEDINLRNVEEASTPGKPKFQSDSNEFGAQESFKDQGFEKSCCFSATCTNVRYAFNIIGCLLAVPNVALDVAYIAKSTFYNKAFYATLIVILLLRIIIVLGSFQCYLFYQLGYKPPMSVSDVILEDHVDNDESVDKTDEAGKNSRRAIEIKQHGWHLYLSMNSLIFLGTFRLLPSKHFPLELSIGYALELIFNLFPTFLVQMFNNSDMPGLLTGIQSVSLLFKILLILVFIVEVIAVTWEIILIRKMRKLKFQEFVKISEEERRRIHSKKYGLLGLLTNLFWVIVLIICLAAASGRNCDLRHSMESGVCVPCQDPLCDSCINDSQVCEECPKSRNGTALFLSNKGQCRQCDIGCDSCVDDGKESTKCTKCAQKFYLSQGKYCRQCLDNGCVKCEDGAGDEQICTQCDDGYFLSSVDKKCRQCNPGCIKCSDKGDGKQQCDQCLDGFYKKAATGQCAKCKVTCQDCEEDPATGNEICKTCQDGFKLDGAKDCEDCYKVTTTEHCRKCDLDSKLCEVCQEGYTYHKALKKCINCNDRSVNCLKCSPLDTQDAGNENVKCEQCDTQIAELDSDGKCLKCKDGWTSVNNGFGQKSCQCENILNTQEGYKCQKCSDLIGDCAACKYTLEPENKLQYFVGTWNNSHSGISGLYSQEDENPRGSQHVICTQAGPGLVAVPVDGQYTIKKCEDVFKGCTKCADKGLSCDKCEEMGWYRYRSGVNHRCGQCEVIPNRPGMEYCEKCNEFVCTQCQEGYHKLMGGCFKCYFDWQCNYFD